MYHEVLAKMQNLHAVTPTNVIEGVKDGYINNVRMVGDTQAFEYLTLNNTEDIITENANEGTDTVMSSVDYKLGNNLESLILTDTTAINATGNELDNSIIGNSANNILTGLAGNDTLDGGTGIDTMIECSYGWRYASI